MTVLTVESPTRLRIQDPDNLDLLKAHLKYVDKKVDFELQKLKHNRWMDVNELRTRIEALKVSRIKSLLFEDDRGYWTYSGISPSLARNLGIGQVVSDVKYPGSKPLPWAKSPEHVRHPYQVTAGDNLLEAKHAAVEIGTGLGKSLIITHVIKSLGLKTVVMAPSVSIARQLYEGLKSAFGGKCVGMFGDGKKDANKLITVGIAQSLTRVDPHSQAGMALAASPVFIADESHLCPASTLAKVCFGLLEASPYRFFFSATQMRNDGLDLLLDSITGPVVYRMTVKEGIDAGYLARLNFTMAEVSSASGFASRDANEMTREHLFYNPRVNKLAGQMANAFVAQGKQVLILVEELEQFVKLHPHFKHEVAFAHGGNATSVLPPEFQKSDPAALVKRFNDGKLPILVGTSCVSIGTDIKANQATINIRGGKSEIEVMQGPVGRSTRLHPPVGKTSCEVVDFNVKNIDVLARHAKERSKIYERVGEVKRWFLG